MDKTIYLGGNKAKSGLRFITTKAENQALLLATDDLKDYIVNAIPRLQVIDNGIVDGLTQSRM
jgi:hypothetical protein